MGDIINLRQVRKAAERRKREEAAAENRSKFGRTKAEKQVARAVEDLEERRLDGHRLTPDLAGKDAGQDGEA